MNVAKQIIARVQNYLSFSRQRGENFCFQGKAGNSGGGEPSQKFSLGQKLIIGMRDESFKSCSKLEVYGPPDPDFLQEVLFAS